MHKTISDLISKNLPQNYRLIRDIACGGNQHIPLFCSLEKSRETQYNNVDLIILREGRILVIIEIEEANVKPIHICGKFLSSALSHYYIHEKEDAPIEMHDRVVFIQVVTTSNLKRDKTSKMEQWKKIEKSIKNILPIKGSRIKEYRIFNEEQLDDLIQFLKQICN